jgi:hypothetical protein
MNKQIALLFSIILLSVTARAQITLTLQVPPFGVLMKNQLWNMTLINTASVAVGVQLGMVMYDEKTNEPVLSASVPTIIVDKGAKQIQAKDLNPIVYTYESAAVTDRDPNGMLPLGQYRVCYTIFRGADQGGVKETCIELSVDPLSPPLLNTPANEAQIYDKSPQFTWLPPTPIGLFGDLSYDLVLVEVLPGQAIADAIEQNVPVYAGGLIRDQYLNYATSYTALDTGRLYAWRIVALNAGLPAGMSDIWTFKVVPPPMPAIKKQYNAFVELHHGLDASLATAGGSLNLSYDNAASDTVVSYTISALQQKGDPVIQNGTLPLRRGHNWLTIPLTNGAYSKEKLYLFQFTNSRNELWTLKFTSAK